MASTVDSQPDYGYPLGTTVYGLHTNKGGVGKTTLTFHLSTTFAELFPDKIVVAIDMCPQSNLSATMLTKNTGNLRESGDLAVQRMQNDFTLGNNLTRTVCGVLRSKLQRFHVEPQKFLTRVFEDNHNPQIPSNLMLLCGDNHLDILVPALHTSAQTTPDIIANPYVETHCYLRDYIRALAEYYKEEEGKELVVFVDTNPAMTIYTHIALCAMTDLIVPLNADDYSLQAVQGMFRQIYALYPSTNSAMRNFEMNTFAWKMKGYGMQLPKIAAIVHNRIPITKENNTAPARSAKNFQAMGEDQCRQFFEGYIEAKRSGEDNLRRIFRLRTDDDGDEKIYNEHARLEFKSDFTTKIRDMRSCGVTAAHCGFPLWQLVNKFDLVAKRLKRDRREVQGRVNGCMKDLLFAMKTIFGEEVMNTADSAAMQRLEQLADQFELNGGNNAGAAGNSGTGDNLGGSGPVRGAGNNSGDGSDSDDSDGGGATPFTPAPTKTKRRRTAAQTPTNQAPGGGKSKGKGRKRRQS